MRLLGIILGGDWTRAACSHGCGWSLCQCRTEVWCWISCRGSTWWGTAVVCKHLEFSCKLLCITAHMPCLFNSSRLRCGAVASPCPRPDTVSSWPRPPLVPQGLPCQWPDIHNSLSVCENGKFSKKSKM